MISATGLNGDSAARRSDMIAGMLPPGPVEGRKAAGQDIGQALDRSFSAEPASLRQPRHSRRRQGANNGWANSPRIEELRAAWLDTTDLE